LKISQDTGFQTVVLDDSYRIKKAHGLEWSFLSARRLILIAYALTVPIG